MQNIWTYKKKEEKKQLRRRKHWMPQRKTVNTHIYTCYMCKCKRKQSIKYVCETSCEELIFKR